MPIVGDTASVAGRTLTDVTVYGSRATWGLALELNCQRVSEAGSSRPTTRARRLSLGSGLLLTARLAVGTPPLHSRGERAADKAGDECVNQRRVTQPQVPDDDPDEYHRGWDDHPGARTLRTADAP